MSRRALFILIILLLVQLFLRVHNTDKLPYFIDEDNHIQRSAAFRHLEQHPAQESHGKFFFYFLLAIVDLKERDTALPLARTMVALSSLLSTALIVATVKKFTDPTPNPFPRSCPLARPSVSATHSVTARGEEKHTGQKSLPVYGEGFRVGLWENDLPPLLAAAFYVLVPYVLFYERMALADSWAGTLGILTLWQSLRLAQKPSYRQAAWVGVWAALTVAAKLTMSFVVGFPLLAFLFFAPYQNLSDAFRRYMPLLVLSGGVFLILWTPILIQARLSLTNNNPDDDFILVNTILLEPVANEAEPPTLLEKFGETWDKSVTMLSLPMTILLLGFIALGLWQNPRPMAFLLMCLVLAWLPTIIAVANLQTRYLISGVPILAVMLGISATFYVGARHASPLPNPSVGTGYILSAKSVSPTDAMYGVPTGVYRWGSLFWTIALFIWGMGFALPFAYTLMTDPPAANLPPLDERNYFWDRYNGYGNREAMAYLQAEGERYDDRVIVFPLTKVCHQVDLDPNPNVTPICIDGHELQTLAEVAWVEAVMPYLEKDIPVYILSSEQPDVPPDQSGIRWEKIAEFPKPRHIQSVTVWRLFADGE